MKKLSLKKLEKYLIDRIQELEDEIDAGGNFRDLDARKDELEDLRRKFKW